MVDEVFTEILGPKRFSSWAKENPLWWILYRTNIPGTWDENDYKIFHACIGKYIIYFDHSRTDQARELCIRIVDRCDNIVAAKVSKFAVDGEKVIVLLARDNTLKRKLSDACKQVDFVMHGFVSKDSKPTEQEKFLRKKYDEYLKALALAYAPVTEHRKAYISSVNFHN